MTYGLTNGDQRRRLIRIRKMLVQMIELVEEELNTPPAKSALVKRRGVQLTKPLKK